MFSIGFGLQHESDNVRDVFELLERGGVAERNFLYESIVEPSAQLQNFTEVDTSLGMVIGVEQNGYRLFRGIPYASPPIGDNRWAPPVPPSRLWLTSNRKH